MGVFISAIGKGSPGENGVPGDTLTNRQLFNRLQKGLKLWQRVGFTLSTTQQVKAYRALDVFERASGIKQRQMFISNTLYPNETLATAACLDVIKEAERKDPNFNRSKIDGLMVVTDTQDTIFPISGKIIAKALGIQPRHSGNASMACSSIVNAIWQACSWMEFDKKCNYVLISTCDITSRLHQPKTLQQPFLFGDQAIALILKRENNSGGFLVSNVFTDTKAPDIIHLALYSGDTDAWKNNCWTMSMSPKNDDNLKRFGRYETSAIAGLYRLYMVHNNGNMHCDDSKTITTTDGLSTQVSSDEYFIPPQIAKKIAQRASESAGINCHSLESNSIRSTVSDYAITGAAGTPLAMYYLGQKRAGLSSRFTAFVCAIGGISSIMTYDPKAPALLKYEYEITPDVVSKVRVPNNDSNRKSNEHLSGIKVQVKQEPTKKLQIDPLEEDETINPIVAEIHRVLSIST